AAWQPINTERRQARGDGRSQRTGCTCNAANFCEGSIVKFDPDQQFEFFGQQQRIDRDAKTTVQGIWYIRKGGSDIRARGEFRGLKQNCVMPTYLDSLDALAARHCPAVDIELMSFETLLKSRRIKISADERLRIKTECYVGDANDHEK